MCNCSQIGFGDCLEELGSWHFSRLQILTYTVSSNFKRLFYYSYKFKPITIFCVKIYFFSLLNPLTPNDDYSGRIAPLTSKRCIIYIQHI